MSNQAANDKERTEAPSADRRFVVGDFIGSLLQQRRLPFLYLVVFLCVFFI